MEEVKMEEVKSLFDREWNKPDDELDAEKRESAKRKMVREFEKSFDEATDQIIALKEKERGMIKERFGKFNLNDFRECRFNIQCYEEAKVDLKKLYFEFFKEEMKR